MPGAWAGLPHWTILQKDFGWGQDFLDAWLSWLQDDKRPRLLHFSAAVHEPPPPEALVERGARGVPELLPLARELAAQWFGLAPGVHRLAFARGRVLLTLAVGDPTSALKTLDLRADALVAGSGATAADSGSTADRSLLAATKRGRRQARPADCVVVGAGLAGAAAAASLARRGWRVRVLDAAPAPAAGASALPAGLVAAHASTDDNLLSRLTRCGIRVTLQQAADALEEGRDWAPCGVLERREGAAALPAMPQALSAWTARATEGQIRAAGLPQQAQGWWHARSAWIRPAALVRAWLAEPGVAFQGDCGVHRIERVEDGWRMLGATGEALAEAPLVVLAAALGSSPWLPSGVELRPVRGQVSYGPLAAAAPGLPDFPVNGNGHFLPRVPSPAGDFWLTGSTYGRGDADAQARPADRLDNLRRLRELLPAAADALAPQFEAGSVHDWSGVRCVARDRRPLVGELQPGLWVSTAMGSRGLSFAALCGELLAARLHGEPLPLARRLARALDVARLVPETAATRA